MPSSLQVHYQQLVNQPGLKAIAGIANTDLNNVLSVVRAAVASGATAVDVAAAPEIVATARAQAPELVIFASSVEPAALLAAVEAGADVVELGNYDALYTEGQFFSEAQVLALAEETVALIDGKALISVTIPGHLAPEAQSRLAKQLEALGVHFLQTEGAARLLSQTPSVALLSAPEKAALTFENTQVLASATRLPLITASGLTVNNLQQAFEAGAWAVGIGSAINQLESEAEMTAVLTKMVHIVSQQAAMVAAA